MADRLEFTLNGAPVSTPVLEDENLLETLRERLFQTSPKNGCSPQGQCGCCTVLLDGKATLSCIMPSSKVAQKQVMTLEGISEAEREIYQQAFIATAGLQCGFCIPGIVMRAKTILSRNAAPTREEIAKQLQAHLCRCTGYVKILDAIELAGRALRGEKAPALDYSGRIGSSLPRYEGGALTLGDRGYIDDLRAPQMLRGAVLLSAHPRALVKKIDVSRASALPGVEAVITAEDVPGQRHQGLIYKDWPLFVALGEETRYVGDILAAVAAVDERTARRAVELIDVDYEVRSPVTNVEDALDPDSPKVHKKGNLLSVSKFRRGEADAALAKSAHVVTETFRTQTIEHLFLEPESCLAVPPGGSLPDLSASPVRASTSAEASNGHAPRLVVYSQGQGVFDDRRQIASALGISEEDLTVVLVTNGGAFGGKEDLSIQAQTALLALKTDKPVKLTLSRDESIRVHPKRHPIKMTYTVGCDAQGRLTAIKARMIGDKGAYASVGSKVLERAAGHATGAYRVDNVDIEALAVYTNNPPNGAMRGFGANQSAFGVEGCIDMLAEKVGLDGWEMRWRNALEVGDRFGTGQVLEKSVGLKKTLLAVKDLYRSAKYAGIACGIKNTGIGNGVPEHGRARLEVERDDTVTIYQGYTEMGQGLFTILVQIASEVTGLDPRSFRVKVDTERPLDCGMTTASRATVMAGQAVKRASEKLKEALKGRKLSDLAGEQFGGEFSITYTTSLEQDVERPITHMSYSFATQVAILDDQGKLKQLVAAHDVGRALNPKLVEGQIEGSVHMGLGYALTEEMRYEQCVPVNTTMKEIGVLRAKDMPDVKVIIVEEPEPEGPYGAKGVGEIGLVPTAPAVAGALQKFDGIRRTRIPMKDSPAAKAMSVGK
jgi:selenium-dependent xanthine dehydrogenase